MNPTETTAAKFGAAVTAALAVAVSVTADGSVSLNDGIAIASAVAGAVAVYYRPNLPRAAAQPEEQHHA